MIWWVYFPVKSGIKVSEMARLGSNHIDLHHSLLYCKKFNGVISPGAEFRTHTVWLLDSGSQSPWVRDQKKTESLFLTLYPAWIRLDSLYREVHFHLKIEDNCILILPKREKIFEIFFNPFFSVKSPECKMGRSYEERVSSYRKTFGPEGAQAANVKETREQVSYR